MGNTLFDQLKKSGLIDEKKAKRVKKEKHRQTKQQKSKQATPPVESTLRAQRAQSEKMVRDRELNQQRKLAAERKAVAAQIKQLIQANHIKDSTGEIGFNFVDGISVQRLYVTEKLQDQLASGHLAIVKAENTYDLVPAAVAEKIKLRDPSCVIFCTVASSRTQDRDDPYGDYQVPDDLMW